ncbi:MAG: hypothetical protein ABMA13_04340 [Chthoniobacteraceae bacterium]
METKFDFRSWKKWVAGKGVRFPAPREWARRSYLVGDGVRKELERRGLLFPGRLPRGVRLPPTTNDARTDSFVRDMTILGVRWPVARDDLRLYRGRTDRVVRILIEHGLIVEPEIYDGTLVPTQVRALEALGITSKHEFREWVTENDPEELRKYRNVGQHSIERLMRWAFGNEAPQVKRGLTVRVSPDTIKGLERLRTDRGFSSHDETIEALVADALRAGGPGPEMRM